MGRAGKRSAKKRKKVVKVVGETKAIPQVKSEIKKLCVEEQVKKKPPVKKITAKEQKRLEWIDIAKQICNDYSTGKYTINSCCEHAGVSYHSFYKWVTNDSSRYVEEIYEMYLDAQKQKRLSGNAKLIVLARLALEKKLSFTKYTETIIEKRGSKVKTKTIEKVMIPSAADIAIALNNLDEDFDRQKTKETEDTQSDLNGVADAMMKRDES